MIIDNHFHRIILNFGYRLRALLCSPLTMCLFRLKAELNVLEHSFHKYLSDTLTLFSLTKMPKPAADFTFLTWFSCDGFFSCVFTCLSIQTLIWILFHIFHNPETFSPCQAFLRAPACCVGWHLTCVHFRTDTFHICAFFPGFNCRIQYSCSNTSLILF